MKNYILLVLVIIIVTKLNTVLAQDNYTLPSPGNIALIKATSKDVDLYKGKTDINIPIYTITDGDLSVNVRLKYNGGNGIKVQEISGESGLGWSLIAGGVITHTKNNRFTYNGYNGPNTKLLKSRSQPDVLNALKFSSSHHLDVFNSTVGGRIIYDVNNIPHFTDEKGFKIEEDGINSPHGRWIIVSPHGDRYYFGLTVDSRERFVSTQGSTQSFSNSTSAWYLNKIESAKGDIIEFEYEKSGNLIQYSYWNFFRRLSSSGSWTTDIREVPSPSEEIHLSKIITRNGIAIFSYKDRNDIQNGKAISDIKIFDRNNSFITKFIFETGYFRSTDPTPTLRLKLNAVRQQGNTSDNTRLLAAFEYNELEKLPARNSKKIDYWGYYNNNTTDKYFISEGANRVADFNKCKANILTGIRWPTGGSTQYTYELNSYRRNNTHFNGGGVRVSSIKEMSGNEISKTTNYDYSTVISGQNITSGLIHNWFDITKGYVAEYTSQNNFMNQNRYTHTKTENALPVKKVIDLDGVSIGYSKVTVIHPDESSEEYYFQDYSNSPDSVDLYTYTEQFFQNNKIKDFVKLSNNSGLYNGISTVTSNNMLRGLLTNKITRNNKNELVKTIRYKYNFVEGSEIAGISSIMLGTYTPSNLQDKEDYFLISLYRERIMTVRLEDEIETTYHPRNNLIDSLRTNTSYEYKQVPRPFLLSKRTQQQSDGSELVATYQYPSDMVSLGKDNTGVYSNMVARNMISSVIEKNDVIDNQQMAFTRTNYGIFNFGSTNNLFLPKSIEVQNGSNPIETKALFNNYSLNGRLLGLTQLDNLNTAYLWGYNGQYLLAEVTNATYNDIAFTSFENGDMGNWTWNGAVLHGNGYEGKNYLSFPSTSVGSISKTGLNASKKYRVSFWAHNYGGHPGNGFVAVSNKGDWTRYEKVFTGVTSFTYSAMNFMLDNISLCPLESFMSTFAYKPLVGMTSRTDSKGVTEYYEYDGFGRLNVVKDFEGNIVKTYCYNYAGQVVDCAATNGQTLPFDILDNSGQKIATITAGSTNPNDYAFSSFEANPNGSPGYSVHNVEWSSMAHPARIDYYTGIRGLDLYDTMEEYVATPGVLDPNKQYKVSYWYRSWITWNAGWIKVSNTFSGTNNFFGYFDEATIDDFMIWPVGSSGVMYVYNSNGSLLTTIPFN